MGNDIGKIYPGMQSGTATLTAGSVVITFAPAFKKVPSVMLTQLTTMGTSIRKLIPAGVTATGFTCVSEEILSISGGTLLANSGTTAVDTFRWWAFVDN